MEPPRIDRGPAPERSPVRARFDSEDGLSTLSVIVRNAQTVKPSLIQAREGAPPSSLWLIPIARSTTKQLRATRMAQLSPLILQAGNISLPLLPN